MKIQFKGLLLILPLAVTLAGYSLPSNAATTRHFDMYQNNPTGGNKCSGQLNCFNSSSPGPDITVNQGDLVSITVHNNDTIQHTFNMSSPYTAVATGTMNGGAKLTLPTFTAGTSGTFNYQCNFHPNDMLGHFIVRAVTPITPGILLALVGTTTAAVYITMRKRR